MEKIIEKLRETETNINRGVFIRKCIFKNQFSSKQKQITPDKKIIIEKINRKGFLSFISSFSGNTCILNSKRMPKIIKQNPKYLLIFIIIIDNFLY